MKISIWKLKAKKGIPEFEHTPPAPEAPVNFRKNLNALEMVERVHTHFREFISERYAPDRIAQANQGIIYAHAEIIYLRECVKKLQERLNKSEGKINCIVEELHFPGGGGFKGISEMTPDDEYVTQPGHEKYNNPLFSDSEIDRLNKPITKYKGCTAGYGGPMGGCTT